MAITATIDFSNSLKLQEAMSKIPSKSEEVVNQVLLTKGTKEVMQGIIGFMPVSNRDKKHAKYSNPLKEKMFNLGFDITTKGRATNKKSSFGYLVFPNDGRGKHNRVAQEFFEKGLQSKEGIVLDYLVEALVKAQEELLSI